MKKPGLFVCLLTAASVLLAAQSFDIKGSQSEDQLRWGVQAYHRGFYSDAVVSLEKSVGIKPSNSLAQAWLGRVLWKSGFEQEALRTWERLQRSGNTDAILRDWISVLRLRSGTARETPREAAFVASAVLDGGMKGGYPFKRPTSVKPRADGSFYLTAFGSNEVLHYDANFGLLGTLRGGLEGFDRPYDVLETADGSLYVSEYGANRITKCNSRGEILKSFGAKGRGDGAFLGPQFMATDAAGFIYVTDWGNSRVSKFDPDGGFILSIKGLSGPSGIAVAEDRVFVSENARKRVSIYDRDGNFIRSIGEGTLKSPEGLSFSRDGRLLVSDANRILEVDLERELWKVKVDAGSHAQRLIQQAMTANGDLLGVDFDKSRLILFSDPVSLYSGLVARVERVNSVKFPNVLVDVSVEDRFGRPVVGLGINNFIVTESRYSVGPTSMVLANTATDDLDVTLLVESSPAMAEFRSFAEAAAADLYALVMKQGRIKAVSAGEDPVKETDFGEARLRFLASAFRAEPSAGWRFDAAARTAGVELVSVPGLAKRAVVFLTTGSLGSRAFQTYSLMNVAAFMRNNSIAFYPVFFGPQGLDEDLAFLVSETGGKSYGVSTPGGMNDVVRDIRSRVTSLYRIGYASPSPAEFGTRYIPLEIEVTMQKTSGRDESGYYAPPSP